MTPDHPPTVAVAHYERTGVILPGHAAAIAAYRREEGSTA